MQNVVKQVHMLSTCHKFANAMFKKLVKKYELARLVCTKYNYEIWIEVEAGPTPGKFQLKEIRNYFMNKGLSKGDCKILDHLNALSAADKRDIDERFARLGANGDECHLYTLANLIKLYTSRYRYLFLPITMDYGQDVGLVHQCALLADLKNREFLFYEPYGTYIKYERDYAGPVAEFLSIYAGCCGYTFTTFHKKIQQSPGIQTIILEANNKKKTEFEVELAALMEMIKGVDPALYDDIQQNIDSDTNPVKKTDFTIAILNVIDEFNHRDEVPGELWNRALEIYYRYNSKSCVSITLSEMDSFFSGGVERLYAEYRAAAIPNEVLMGRMTGLLAELGAAAVDPAAANPTLCRAFAAAAQA